MTVDEAPKTISWTDKPPRYVQRVKVVTAVIAATSVAFVVQLSAAGTLSAWLWWAVLGFALVIPMAVAIYLHVDDEERYSTSLMNYTAPIAVFFSVIATIFGVSLALVFANWSLWIAGAYLISVFGSGSFGLALHEKLFDALKAKSE